MESSLFRQITELVREHKTTARVMAIFLCLALVVTTATVGVLTFTGHAMTQKVKVLTCQYKVHEHTDACKNEDGDLICGYADYVVHVHNDDCYDEDGALVCPLPEVKPHVHEDSCYGEVKTPICGQEEAKGHEHTEACFDRQRGELICAQQEHTHGPECFLREEVLTCDKTEQEHIHSDDCYTVSRELSCGEEEGETHTHSDACYTEVRTLTCDKTTEPHVHGPECYTVNETLICEIPEHTHSDDCYEWTETLICDIPEGQIPEGGHVHTEDCFVTTRELTCGKLENHEHTDDCFAHDEEGNRIGNPICGKIELLEHVHGDGCFTIEERTVEDQDPAAGPFFFQMVDTSDLETVCGKTEHTHDDSCRDENGEIVCGLEEHTHDESCLALTGGDAAPVESAAPEVICGKEEHTHDDSCRDESGEIVCGIEEHTHDESCLAPAEAAQAEPLTKTFQDNSILVTVTYPKEANIPEEAELRATQMTASGDIAAYEQNLEDVLAAVEGQMEVNKVLLYDIGFYMPDGEKVEPDAPVTVTIQFLDENGIPSGAPVTVVHLAESGTEILPAESDENGVSFETGSFSPFSFLIEKLRSGLLAPAVAIVNGNVKSSDLRKFVDSVVIKDKDGKVIEDGGTFYVGENYTIELKFKEGGAIGIQFDTSAGQLTYQIPDAFKVDVHTGTITVTIDGVAYEIPYEVTEDGRLIVTPDDDVKAKIAESNNIELSFEMSAIAQWSDDSDGGHVSFGDTGKDFHFQVVDQPRVSVKKSGKYTESASAEEGKMAPGGTLEYTVETTVEHGQVHDVVVTDVLTPPDTDALELKMRETAGAEGKTQPAVTVKIKGKDGNEKTLDPSQYELVRVADEELHPQDQAFRVKLKDPQYLNEGEVLSVTYNYDVRYVEGATGTFWGNVKNEATATGGMTIKNPEDVGGETEGTFEEKQGSNIEIFAQPPGDGIVYKEQEYSEATHTLHYTCYTVIPKGMNWKPLFINDDMIVRYDGEQYYLWEFTGNRFQGLKVSAVDLDTDWGAGTDKSGKVETLQELKAKAHQLKGYAFDRTEGYDFNSIENYVYILNDNTLDIVFGYTKGSLEWAGQWFDNPPTGARGEWKTYLRDRLIITEYDLDMSDESGSDILELHQLSDTNSTINVSPKDVLTNGITNNVNLRLSNYYPGYSVFFNNTETMNKTGKLNKDDNTIEYTVTMNTTDSTVNKYFQDVAKDWTDQGVKCEWDPQKTYGASMKAVFYDVLPDGWKYVWGSLTATACDIWGNKASYPFNDNGFLEKGFEVKPGGANKQEISAPLTVFNDTKNKERPNLFNWFGNDLVQLTFTYKLKATDEWLKAHALNESVNVDNHAWIKDENSTHWDADATVPYFPARLTKTAKQVNEGSNRLEFTLKVNNPAGADLVDTNYLTVTDTSSGIEILLDTIKVTNAAGTELKRIEPLDDPKKLPSDEWYLLKGAEGDEFEFKLIVPDSVALNIIYQAQLNEMGDVTVSNKASIDGVNNSSSGGDITLNVSHVEGTGSGSTYRMNVIKVDSRNPSKQLAGAKFKFYMVDMSDTPEESSTSETVKIGDKSYPCITENNWSFTTGEDGTYLLQNKGDKLNWRLEPGHYYILVETDAPAGYEKLDPILFFYGLKKGDGYNEEAYPDAKIVVPSGTAELTIKDPPIPYELPESGGVGSTELYVLGSMLILAGLTLYFTRPRKKESEG